ncbi:MAG: hypothetical protein EBQ48_02560 [Betaproteobacteria bacterium]|nr:hypothetical protein [Betaproteobacteria bacterium]
MAEVEFVKSSRKARWSISKGQLDLLSDWMGGCAGLRLARRAWFILSEQQGFPVHRYFQATPVPSRRIQALMQQFDRLGPFGLIEQARSGRPNAADQSWTARRTASGEHWVLVRNVALEGGRRRTRTLKLKMPRPVVVRRFWRLPLITSYLSLSFKLRHVEDAICRWWVNA